MKNNGVWGDDGVVDDGVHGDGRVRVVIGVCVCVWGGGGGHIPSYPSHNPQNNCLVVILHTQCLGIHISSE